MKTLEFNHGNDWRDKLLNRWPLCLDTKSIKPIIRAGVCRTDGLWHVWATTKPGDSLFYNGAIFFRFMIPFWIGFHIRFTSTRFLQCGIGWKMNGRFGILFRVQSDVTSAIGTHGPNIGQATGWECGTK